MFVERIKSLWNTVDLQPIYGKLGGKSWILVIFFALTAFYLALHNELTGAYAATISSLSGFHVGRAIASDYHDRRMAGK
jgi:hypothetical protein